MNEWPGFFIGVNELVVIVKKVTIMICAVTWDKFREICRKKDLTASQVLRKHVRDTVEAEPNPEKTETPEE